MKFCDLIRLKNINKIEDNFVRNPNHFTLHCKLTLHWIPSSHEIIANVKYISMIKIAHATHECDIFE